MSHITILDTSIIWIYRHNIFSVMYGLLRRNFYVPLHSKVHYYAWPFTEHAGTFHLLDQSFRDIYLGKKKAERSFRNSRSKKEIIPFGIFSYTPLFVDVDVLWIYVCVYVYLFIFSTCGLLKTRNCLILRVPNLAQCFCKPKLPELLHKVSLGFVSLFPGTGIFHMFINTSHLDLYSPVCIS